MLDGHARGLEAVDGMLGELFFEGWSPAELCKQRKSPFEYVRTPRLAGGGDALLC
jgi:hypothetical protein